jgi:hypothetical protein
MAVADLAAHEGPQGEVLGEVVAEDHRVTEERGYGEDEERECRKNPEGPQVGVGHTSPSVFGWRGPRALWPADRFDRRGHGKSALSQAKLRTTWEGDTVQKLAGSSGLTF